MASQNVRGNVQDEAATVTAVSELLLEAKRGREEELPQIDLSLAASRVAPGSSSRDGSMYQRRLSLCSGRLFRHLNRVNRQRALRARNEWPGELAACRHGLGSSVYRCR